MKKRILVIIALCMCFIYKVEYKAVCNDEGIISSANGIMAYSSAIRTTDVYDGEDEVRIYIENIPSNMYLIVVNNTRNKKETIKEFTDGYTYVKTPACSTQYDYTVKVYCSDEICKDELIRTIKVKSLVFNEFAEDPRCGEYASKIKDFDFDGCNVYASKVYTSKTFEADLDAYLNKIPEELSGKLKDLFYKYYYFALIPIVILGAYYAVRIILVKRSKKKNEEM